MLLTIGDVATAARKVWIDAVTINVGLSPTNSLTQKMYRVTAIGPNNRLLGRLEAPSLNELKALLDKRLLMKDKPEPSSRESDQPIVINPAGVQVAVVPQDRAAANRLELRVADKTPTARTNKIDPAFEMTVSMVVHSVRSIPKRKRIAAGAENFAIVENEAIGLSVDCKGVCFVRLSVLNCHSLDN